MRIANDETFVRLHIQFTDDFGWRRFHDWMMGNRVCPVHTVWSGGPGNDRCDLWIPSDAQLVREFIQGNR